MPDLSKLSDAELLALHAKAKAAPAPAAADLRSLSDAELMRLHDLSLSRARPKTEAGESFVRGAVQGATLGFSDELYGAGAGLVDWVRGKGELGKSYARNRDDERARNAAALADNPKTYIGGSVAGGVATSLIPGVGIAKGATLVGGAAKAAALGGVTGAGLTEANPLAEPEDFAKDVGKGAAIGAAFQGGAHILGKAAGAMRPEALRSTANIKAAKAAGALGSDLKKLGPEKTQAMGEAVQKAGLKAFDSLEEVGAKLATAKEEAGQAIGKALDSVDELVVQAKAGVDKLSVPAQAKANLRAAIDKQFQFNMTRIGERIEKELIAPNAKNPLLKGELAKLQGIADDFRAGGSVTMREGNVIKGTQGRVTNFNSETVPQAFKQEVYGIIKRELDDIVGRTGSLEAGVGRLGAEAGVRGIGEAPKGAFDVGARNQSVAKAYGEAKKAYGALSDAERINVARQGSAAGNREISLTDTIAGAGAATATGSPQAVVVATGLNKLARQYGDSVMAVGARRAADLIEKAPQRLGRFYNVLAAAAAKGAPALDATHLALMKEPDYRKILDLYEKSRAIQRRVQGGTP